jgi:hypothetical protein
MPFSLATLVHHLAALNILLRYILISYTITLISK